MAIASHCTKAIDYYQRSLAIKSEIKDRNGEALHQLMLSFPLPQTVLLHRVRTPHVHEMLCPYGVRVTEVFRGINDAIRARFYRIPTEICMKLEGKSL